MNMETNNLMSNIMLDSKNPKPEVGMGITVCMYSDRHAGTITRISESGKTIWFKEDIATRIDTNGMSDSQTYEYEFNEKAPEQKATLRKDGIFRKSVSNIPLTIGVRREYYDYSF